MEPIPYIGNKCTREVHHEEIYVVLYVFFYQWMEGVELLSFFSCIDSEFFFF